MRPKEGRPPLPVGETKRLSYILLRQGHLTRFQRLSLSQTTQTCNLRPRLQAPILSHANLKQTKELQRSHAKRSDGRNESTTSTLILFSETREQTVSSMTSKTDTVCVSKSPRERRFRGPGQAKKVATGESALKTMQHENLRLYMITATDEQKCGAKNSRAL